MKGYKLEEDDPYKVLRNWPKQSDTKTASVGSLSSGSKEGVQTFLLDEIRLMPVPCEDLHLMNESRESYTIRNDTVRFEPD